MKKTPAKGHTRKHTGTRKHAQHHAKHHPTHHPKGATAAGHHVHAVAKHPHHAKARGLALGDSLPVCAAQALAASLRLAGQPVGDDDVAQLWELTGAREDGASIQATLAAAARFGLAGCRPVLYRPVGGFGVAATRPVAVAGLDELLRVHAHGLVLGVELPGAHTVLATAGGWWSWGDLHDPAQFPHALIEECWAVSWS